VDGEKDVEKNWRVPFRETTASCERYFVEHFHLMGFVEFVATLVVEAGKEARARGERMPELQRPYSGLFMEMAYCRAVDNFLAYVSSLLAEVFSTRPETLHSAGSIPVSLVLEHATRDDLVRALAEQHVDRLGYLGLRKLRDDLKGKLGFDLFPEAFDNAVEIVEIRNLIVHNRGVVNRTFLKRVPWSNAQLGDALTFGVDDAVRAFNTFGARVADIDPRAISKFGLAATSGAGIGALLDKLRPSDGAMSGQSELPRSSETPGVPGGSEIA
jgi:hypothetical protein